MYYKALQFTNICNQQGLGDSPSMVVGCNAPVQSPNPFWLENI